MGDATIEDILEFFPHPSFRDGQKIGTVEAYSTMKNGGFYVFEGACGTGKTAMALSSALTLVRDNDTKFERVLVLTSVKQQLPVFVEEMRKINQQVEKPVRTMTAVGKPDLCPYVEKDTFNEREAYDECTKVQDNTRDYAESGDNAISTLNKLVSEAPDSGFAGEYEFSSELPETEYCPYYAQYLIDNTEDNSPRNNSSTIPYGMFDTDSIATRESMLSTGAKAGTCPHMVSGDMLEKSEVILGNYTHVFDKLTSEQRMSEVIGKDTIVIFDEAHNMARRVRDILSNEVEIHTIERVGRLAVDIGQMLSCGKKTLQEVQNRDHTEIENRIGKGFSIAETSSEWSAMAEELKDEYSSEDGHRLSQWGEKLIDLTDIIYSKIIDEDDLTDGNTIKIQEEGEEGKLQTWKQFSNKDYSSSKELGKLIEEVAFALDSEVSIPGKKVGTVVEKALEGSTTDYFRDLTVEETNFTVTSRSKDWQENYRVTLNVRCCLPKREIQSALKRFGAGVLMSATLQPFDVFITETGLDSINRPVRTNSFPLPFPENNRTSIVCPLQPFTYKNRSENNAQKEYYSYIKAVLDKVNGTTLIVAPSYSQAEWFGFELRKEYGSSREVFIDSSTTNTITERMKEDFFESSDGVLVTGAHGTLIEGVDYEGDKLENVIIVGVPIQDISGKKNDAIQKSYEDEFGEGFEYAFTVPAVRKSRQAIGRCIRTKDDVGNRIFLDVRYSPEHNRRHSVTEYLPEELCNEIVTAESKEELIKLLLDDTK